MFNLVKKKISSILVFALVISLFTMVFSLFSAQNLSASAEQIYDTEQAQMEKTIYETALEEGYVLKNLSYIKDDIYFSDETKGGYLIEFSGGDCVGYAIFFKIENMLKLIELNFNGHSPYYNREGMRIYPSLGYYYLKINNKYYDAITMENLNNYTPTDFPTFFAACKSDDKSDIPVTRNVSYSKGSLYKNELLDFYVCYSTSLTSHSNNCANAAGLIMLNYWNKKYENDLLKLDQNDLKNGNITGDKRAEFMGIFYDYMNTNWFFGTGGTLPNDCYKGFEKLIKEKNYSVSRDKNLSYDEMVSYIDEGIPIFIVSTNYYFSSGTNTTNLPIPYSNPGDHTLTISYLRSHGLANSHTFVGYGYAYYDLYDSNGKKFQEQLIKVADGWGGSCYFNYTVSNKFSTAAIDVYKN